MRWAFAQRRAWARQTCLAGMKSIYHNICFKIIMIIVWQSLANNNLLMSNGSKWTNSTMSIEMNNDVYVTSITTKIFYVEIAQIGLMLQIYQMMKQTEQHYRFNIKQLDMWFRYTIS